MDLKSVPLFWKPYGEGAPKREPRSQPTGEDTASSTGMGRRFSKVPDFSRNNPVRHLTGRLTLTTMNIQGCLISEFPPPFRHPDPQEGLCLCPPVGKALAPSTCPHRCLSAAQGRGSRGREGKCRNRAVLWQQSTLVFNS